PPPEVASPPPAAKAPAEPVHHEDAFFSKSDPNMLSGPHPIPRSGFGKWWLAVPVAVLLGFGAVTFLGGNPTPPLEKPKPPENPPAATAGEVKPPENAQLKPPENPPAATAGEVKPPEVAQLKPPENPPAATAGEVKP